MNKLYNHVLQNDAWVNSSEFDLSKYYKFYRRISEPWASHLASYAAMLLKRNFGTTPDSKDPHLGNMKYYTGKQDHKLENGRIVLDVDYLHNAFNYNADGYLEDLFGNRAAFFGSCVGYKGKYVVVINDHMYSEHRLIYAMHHPEVALQDFDVSHIDGDMANNKIENLKLKED